MERTRLVLALVIALILVGAIAGTIIVLDRSEFNPKIVCSAAVISSLTVAHYYPDGDFEPNFVPMPQSANLSLQITNNVSRTLYDIVVEVRYKTSEGSWNTTRTVIDSLGIQESRTVNVPLANPAITTENTTELATYYPNDPNHNWNPHSVHLTEYVLSLRDHEIDAYGFAKPADDS
jgi:hypothetical protein